MLKLISELDEFKGSWKMLGTLEPERLASLRHVATIESIGSSTRIEGSKLSDLEIHTLLSNIGMSSFSNRDEQEVAGYAKVMELIFDAYEDVHITENHIKQLHRDLLFHSEKDHRHRGGYKNTPNNVVAFDQKSNEIGVVFETSSPFDTPRHMQELVEWFHNELEIGRLHHLLLIGIFIVTFLEIHPFQDGNGRLSRILTTLLLLRSGYKYVPYASLESIIELNKERYYQSLRDTQITIRSKSPKWEPWLVFFLTSLQKQSRNLGKKVDIEKSIMAQLPEVSLQILEHIKVQGRISVGEMAKQTGISRNTLKDHFKKLSQNGYIVLHGQGRGAWYSLK